MYLIPIHVPIYRDGDQAKVTSDWKRSLVLLRDSLQGRYGALRVVAPSRPMAEGARGQRLEPFGAGDDIELVPSFDSRCRAREYWLRHRASWIRTVRRHVAEADVVHTALDDLYQPIAFEGVREALRQHKPTVFFQDVDHASAIREGSLSAGARAALRASILAFAYEQACRWCVRRADVSFLKGCDLMERYGRFARNAREFHDTSYFSDEIVAAEVLERRLARLMPGKAVRLVYCGRLVERKGVMLSLQLLARAVAEGAPISLDVIGDGPQRPALETAAAAPPLAGRVRFLGSIQYGSALLERLAGYDALLFTPAVEDTPRMIFDGYAAGLPLVGTDIAYVRERERAEHAAVVLARRDHAGCARVLVELARRPAALAPLARAARVAAEYHAADAWYRRRAAWTFEAVERHRAVA